MVPYLDAQPCVSQPATPLNGVGLIYKQAPGFGGYVTPLIYISDPFDRNFEEGIKKLKNPLYEEFSFPAMYYTDRDIQRTSRKV